MRACTPHASRGHLLLRRYYLTPNSRPRNRGKEGAAVAWQACLPVSAAHPVRPCTARGGGAHMATAPSGLLHSFHCIAMRHAERLQGLAQICLLGHGKEQGFTHAVHGARAWVLGKSCVRYLDQPLHSSLPPLFQFPHLSCRTGNTCHRCCYQADTCAMRRRGAFLALSLLVRLFGGRAGRSTRAHPGCLCHPAGARLCRSPWPRLLLGWSRWSPGAP